MTFRLFKNIRELQYFTVGNYKEDLKKKAELIGNIIGLLYGIILFGLFINLAFGNNFHLLDFVNILSFLIIFWAIIYVILRLSKTLLTSILIFSSTIPGLMVIMTILLFTTFLLSIVTSFINNDASGNIDNITFNEYGSLILLAIYAPKYYPIIWLNVITSLTIQLLIILTRPPYLISKTKSSFRLISVSFSLITASLFLYSSDLKDILLNAVNSYQFDPDEIQDIINYFGSFDKSMITENLVQRLITIIFLPYTIGSLLCLYIIDCKENSFKKKAKHFFYNALYCHSRNLKRRAVLYLKKCHYFGGDIYEMNILNCQYFKEYVEELGYIDCVEKCNPDNIRFVNKLNRFINKIKMRYGFIKI